MSDAPKKGSSIWSLLVIMTLLAVWLAVPRRMENLDLSNWSMYFFVGHQVVLWLLIAALIWILFGRRKMALLLSLALIVVAWGPITLSLIEAAAFDTQGKTIAERFLRTVGLIDLYDDFYETIFNGFGYGFQN